MCKKAFTLAEILITLGIIGVVAAMTLPVLIQKYKAKVILTQLKKSYAEIQNVSNSILNDYGDNIFNIVTSIDNAEAKNIFMKYYPGAVDCQNCTCYTSKGIKYETYSGKSISCGNYYFGLSQFLTKDGRLISIGGYNDTYAGRMITVDVNGPFTKPNAWGRDTFTFRITENKVAPCGGRTACSNPFNYNCRKLPDDNYSGIGCTYYALTKPDFLYKKYYYEDYTAGEM